MALLLLANAMLARLMRPLLAHLPLPRPLRWALGRSGMLPQESWGHVSPLTQDGGRPSARHFVRMQQPADCSPPPVGSVAVKNVSSTVSLYSRVGGPAEPSRDGEMARPLLLLLPWLGSKPSSISRYCELYLQRGFDVLAVESSAMHFLWPQHGQAYAEQVLELLENEEGLSSRPLYVHAFSIGAYTFTQMLVHMGRDATRYKEIKERIKGQVYDSLVLGSVERMAIGLSKMVDSTLLVPLLKRSVLLYFSLLKSYTVDYYNTAIDAFWQGPLTCPALFFYCENDPLSDHVMMGQLIEAWQKKGIQVVGKSWKSSKHAGHLRRHRQEYQETLSHFLQQQHPECPLKSKL